MITKKSIRLPSGETVNGIVVGINRSVDHFNEITLEDGTTLKAKLVVTEVARIPNEWDENGYPRYVIFSHNAVTVARCPDQLRKLDDSTDGNERVQ